MVYKDCPLPKTVDERVKRYLGVPKNENGRPSHHGLKVAQGGKVDIYGPDVYDFDDPRFLGKGCFSNRASQPITIDGIDYPNVHTYMYIMSCKDPQEASKWLLDRGSFYDKGSLTHVPKKNEDFSQVEREILRTAVHAKLTQHVDTVGELLATGNKYIANTSQDRLYGTGFNGEGSNWLGETYMDARDHILSTILQNKTVHPISNPSQDDINELAAQFQDKHPDEVEKMIKEMVRQDMSDVVDMAYPDGPKKFRTPTMQNVNFYPEKIVGAIKDNPKYKSYKCSDHFEYLRPPQTASDYHDRVHDKYQELYNIKERDGERIATSLRDYRDTNPFYGPIDFMFRGVGPIPGPAPLAVISAVVCFGLMATGVGAAVIVGVAIGFSMVSGAVQAYKSATDNGLDTKKTIAATVLGAASGILAPWPGLGPLMSALYVKAVEKGLKLGKGAMDVYFPKKDKSEVPKRNNGVDVLEHQQQRGVEVLEPQQRKSEVQVLEQRKEVKRHVPQHQAQGADVSPAKIVHPSMTVDSRRKGVTRKHR